jgi:hypothetical protein
MKIEAERSPITPVNILVIKLHRVVISVNKELEFEIAETKILDECSRLHREGPNNIYKN